ncbi:Uncharacterised protein [uncultured archaeon]|nr:Uncharacterised protein [uncultured archaeon]
MTIIPCPSCTTQLSYKKSHDNDILLSCPVCGQVVLFKGKKSLINQPSEKSLFKKILLDKRILGLILIIVGLIFFNFSNPMIIRIGITIIVIGILITLLKTKESSTIISWDKHIFLLLIGWILIMFVLTSNSDVTLFIILIIIGILVIRELATQFITIDFKKRLNIIIIIFLIIYILIIIHIMKII